MGDLGGEDRVGQYWSLKDLRGQLAQQFTLQELDERTGGPARYVRLEETGQKIGFITKICAVIFGFTVEKNKIRLFIDKEE